MLQDLTTLTPLVSVILPFYNRASYVDQAIQSVLAQTYSNWELLIADNGSSIDSRAAVEKYYDIERIRHYHNEVNIGLFPNLNYAISLCKGDYILLLCDDDFLLPQCIESYVSHALQFSSAELIISPIECVDSQGNSLSSPAIAYFREFAPQSKLSSPENTLPLLLKYGSINGNLTGMFFKHDLPSKVGFFLEDRLQAVADWEWLYRVAKKFPIVLISYSLVVTRHHSERVSGENFANIGNAKGVSEMIRNLLTESCVKEIKLSRQWANNTMQFYLWYAFKALFRGNFNRFTTLVYEVQCTTGIFATFWALLLFLPERWRIYVNKDFPRNKHGS